MTLRIEDTTAAEVSSRIRSERHRLGATATGMVLTLVIVCDEENQSDATRAAAYSAGDHPCRILTIIPRPGKVPPRLDAEISVGDSDGPGETVKLRLRGPLANHASSVVLPLLLSDTPVVTWWPTACPDVPVEDPLGSLAQRRITDMLQAKRPMDALLKRQSSYAEGDTDLAWTRLTPWRSVLASALDEPYDRITSVSIDIERNHPSGPLLQGWMQSRLGVPVSLRWTKGPGLTGTVIETEGGQIVMDRRDGQTATLTRPGGSTRELTVPIREMRDLIAEELRRLDPDQTYAEALVNLHVPTTTPRGDGKSGTKSSTKGEDKSIARQRSTARGKA